MSKKIGSDLCPVLCPASLAINFVVQTNSTSGTLRQGDLILGVDYHATPDRVYDLANAKDRDDMLEILRDNFYGAGVYVRRGEKYFLINDFYEETSDPKIACFLSDQFRSIAQHIMVSFSKK